MFETWTAANRVVSNGLMTNYTETYDRTSMNAPFYEYHRIRTKSYSYVGLTESAAKRCAQAMLEKYTRLYRNWEWYNGSWRLSYNDNDRYEALVASVNIVHDEGHLWHVEIGVNEECIVYSRYKLTNLEDPFNAYYKNFDYDEA